MQQASLTFEEWLESRYRQLAGADGEGEGESSADGGEGSTGENGEGSGESSTTATGEADAESEEEGDSDEDNTDADADELERIKKERDEARDRVARAEAAAQKAKAEARKAREEAAKKHGNWEQVAKEREAELAEANERVTGAESRAVKAEDELDSFRREVRITRLAARLSFRDPADAMAALAGEPDKTGDDKSCERALRDLAKQKPYLIDERRARGRAMGGNGNGAGLLTKEQMDKMTPEQITEAWNSGVMQRSLAALGPGGG